MTAEQTTITAREIAEWVSKFATLDEDHRPDRPDSWERQAVYIAHGLPNSVIGFALWSLRLIGTGIERHWSRNISTPAELLRSLGVDLTDGWATWFDTIAQAEDSGKTWGEALEMAGEAPE
ncbi:hypothetical protein [Gordonia soli]|nr:hypothetical protein [Gordonia soli]